MISDKEIQEKITAFLRSVHGRAGPADLYRAAAKAGWEAATVKWEPVLRKLRDAAAVSQQNADQVGIGQEYAEATRLLDEFKECKP